MRTGIIIDSDSKVDGLSLAYFGRLRGEVVKSSGKCYDCNVQKCFVSKGRLRFTGRFLFYL